LKQLTNGEIFIVSKEFPWWTDSSAENNFLIPLSFLEIFHGHETDFCFSLDNKEDAGNEQKGMSLKCIF